MESREARREPDDELRWDRGRALHEQLTDRLLARVQQEYALGERLPTEAEIGVAYGVSRVTVRRALQTLQDQGILVKRQGIGTFLARKRKTIVYEIGRFGPFLDVFSGEGGAVSVELMDFNRQPGELWPNLGKHQKKVLAYSRRYATAGFTHALLRIAVPGELGKRVTRRDAASMGVYKLLEERLGIVPVEASFRISSELPDIDLAAALSVSRATPLLKVERTSYDGHGDPVECTVHYLLPDVYTLRTTATK